MTTEYTNLKPGDMTFDGMIVVGPFKGRLLLREPFSKATMSEFLLRSEAHHDEFQVALSKGTDARHNVPPHPAKRTHLPNKDEGALIASTLSAEERKNLENFWLDGHGESKYNMLTVKWEELKFEWSFMSIYGPRRITEDGFSQPTLVPVSRYGCLVRSIDL